jgi:hypothetical protein
LIANGDLYAAFGSFCDHREDVSRGWILGWGVNDLNPLPHPSYLVDQLGVSRGDARYADGGFISNPFDFYLSSIWMSGYGVAADPDGNLFFVTGNSTKFANTYLPPYNLQDSVVKLSGDHSTVIDWFTPSPVHEYRTTLCLEPWRINGKCYLGVDNLDKYDLDFGSGGVMLLPDQDGGTPHLAVAIGKVGQLFLLNRDKIGGFGANVDDNVLQSLDLGDVDSCYCGPGYFEIIEQPRGLRATRVVTSVGNTIRMFDFSPQSGTLVEKGTPSQVLSGEPNGFFTTISSNGVTPGSAVIWAVPRPVPQAPYSLTLYAFDPADMTKPIYSGEAGTWPNIRGNANVVPVVADGRVFVASHGELDIFTTGVSGTDETRSRAVVDAANELRVRGQGQMNCLLRYNVTSEAAR